MEWNGMEWNGMEWKEEFVDLDLNEHKLKDEHSWCLHIIVTNRISNLFTKDRRNSLYLKIYYILHIQIQILFSINEYCI